jgi:hypothetical protein
MAKAGVTLDKMELNELREGIRKLIYGHYYRGQGSGPAARDERGCVIPQKAANRKENGYVQFKAGDHTVQASRVVCFLNPDISAAEKERMLRNDLQASHICHNSLCIAEAHIILETFDANEARKVCARKVNVITTIDGQRYIMLAEKCNHVPRCHSFRTEERDHIKLE